MTEGVATWFPPSIPVCGEAQLLTGCGDVVVVGAFRKTPEASPKTGRWPLLQQHVASFVDNYEQQSGLYWQALAGLAGGVLGGGTTGMSLAI